MMFFHLAIRVIFLREKGIQIPEKTSEMLEDTYIHVKLKKKTRTLDW